jgi:hypothetical protein
MIPMHEKLKVDHSRVRVEQIEAGEAGEEAVGENNSSHRTKAAEVDNSSHKTRATEEEVRTKIKEINAPIWKTRIFHNQLMENLKLEPNALNKIKHRILKRNLMSNNSKNEKGKGGSKIKKEREECEECVDVGHVRVNIEVTTRKNQSIRTTPIQQ